MKMTSSFVTIVCGHLHLFDVLADYKAPAHVADARGAYPIHYAAQLPGLTNDDELHVDAAKGK
jgi:hypothetical protein